MLCPKCNTSVTNGSNFCINCGTDMQQLGESEVAAVAQPVPQAAPASSANTFAGKPTEPDPREKVYGIGGYFITLLILCVPLVNIVMLFVWAFSRKVNKNKKNMAIAMLILFVVMIAVSLVLSTTFTAVFEEFLNQLPAMPGKVPSM